MRSCRVDETEDRQGRKYSRRISRTSLVQKLEVGVLQTALQLVTV